VESGVVFGTEPPTAVLYCPSKWTRQMVCTQEEETRGVRGRGPGLARRSHPPSWQRRHATGHPVDSCNICLLPGEERQR